MNYLAVGFLNASSSILRSLNFNQNLTNNIQTQLSTNKKILDPALQGVVTRLSSQVTCYTAAQSNIAKAENVLNVASTGLSSIAKILTQMQGLASKAHDSTTTTSDRAKLNQTFQSLLKQINSTANNSKIDGTGILASGSNNLAIQTGITVSDTTTITGAPSTTKNLFKNIQPTIGVGTPPTSFNAISSSAQLTLDGVTVGNIPAGANAQQQGVNIAAAINLVSSQTGVTANADTTTGAVTLIAVNGSDIVMGTGWNQIGSGLGLGYSGSSLTGVPPTYFSSGGF